MRKVKYAGIQMSCTRDVRENIEKADRLVREAAANGAQIILLPELFENWYFCQERNYESYKLAKPLMENDAVTLEPETSGTDLTYQWLHNDEEIPGAVEKTYTVTAKDQEDCGVYSVRILSQGGTSKTVDVCEIKNVVSAVVPGDLNQDGICSAADLVMLQKYLLGDLELTQEQALRADMTQDQVVNGFDLVRLRLALSEVSE